MILLKKDFSFFLFLPIFFYIKGLVAQWTRACGYEPQSRGFESLLAHFETFVWNVFYKTKKIGYLTKSCVDFTDALRCLALNAVLQVKHDVFYFVKNKAKNKGFYKKSKKKKQKQRF